MMVLGISENGLCFCKLAGIIATKFRVVMVDGLVICLVTTMASTL